MEDLVEHAEGNGGGCLVAAMGAARELVKLVEQTDPERFGRDQHWQRCVAPVGASVAGQLVCKTILAIVSAKQDSIQYFLRDPRNLAAGAARAALWLSAQEVLQVKAAEGDKDDAEEGVVKKVVRRCRVPYMCSVRVGGLVEQSAAFVPSR